VNTSVLPRDLSGWLDLLESRHPVLMDLGLDRCGEVWRKMGSPRPAPRVIVVAGTNGKGSTVATVSSLLGSLGHRYGVYTSPHLLRFNERICLDGTAVNDDELLLAFGRVEAARGAVSLTYFEFTTLAAFDVLSRSGVEYAVLEVGLGGRLDTVNLIDADCGVITPIGLDHQDYLGPDRESIGREKADIIRPGRPVICGEREPPASVLTTAAERGAPLKRLGDDFSVTWSGEGVRFRMGEMELDLPQPALSGGHQQDNLATALAAVLTCIPGAASRTEALRSGVRAVSLAGRMQRISQRPAVWVDVGHNPMAARAIAESLSDITRREGIPHCRAVLAMLADKDAVAVVQALSDVISAWYLAGTSGDRGQSGHRLAQSAKPALQHLPWQVFGSVGEAIDSAMADAGDDGGVLVFGSFVTAADALRHWMLLESTHRAAKRIP
jgi:dihydrofolate synthase/folylpolyglutamate synthase